MKGALLAWFVLWGGPPHLVQAPLFSHGQQPVDLGDTPAEMQSAAACAECHPEEHAEWARSAHGRAWTGRIFRTEYELVGRRWCAHCHAPLSRPGPPGLRSTPAAVEATHPHATEGINCAVCHVRDGRIIAKRRGSDSPHDTVERADFGGPAFCGGCHEFTFPIFDDAGGLRPSAHPMQATMSQFLSGPHADRPGGCRGCHTSPAGHLYPGAHDPEMLARALAFEVCRSDGAVWMRVHNRGAGHNVPTGDIHRHLYARAWRSSAPAQLYEAFVGRRFGPADDGGKITTWDSTVPPGGAREYRIEPATLGGSADELMNFELRYVYTRDEHPGPRTHPGVQTWRTVATQRARLEALPTCGGG